MANTGRSEVNPFTVTLALVACAASYVLSLRASRLESRGCPPLRIDGVLSKPQRSTKVEVNGLSDLPTDDKISQFSPMRAAARGYFRSANVSSEWHRYNIKPKNLPATFSNLAASDSTVLEALQN